MQSVPPGQERGLDGQRAGGEPRIALARHVGIVIIIAGDPIGINLRKNLVYWIEIDNI